MDKLTQAEALRVKKETILLSQYAGINLRSVNLFEYFDSYINRCELKSIRKYKSTYNHVLDYFNNKLISNYTNSECQGFLDSLYSRFSIDTANSYIKCLKKIFNLALSDRLITESPAKNLRLKSPPTNFNKPIILIDGVLELWRNVSKDVTERAFVFACYTGIGREEALYLDQSNVSNKNFTYTRAKNGRHVNMRLKDKLKDLADSEGLLFKDLPSHRIMNLKINKFISRCGVSPAINKRMTFYGARHSFAVNLAMAGIDKYTIARYLGHVDTKHTDKYLRYVETLEDNSIDLLQGL